MKADITRNLNQELLRAFLKRFWEFYDQLLDYRGQPTPEAAIQLETKFDELFASQTGYAELDKRIAKTRAKKDSLLLVLKHPELPLHNNAAELAARFRVRKSDISFGPRTEDGKRAWDTFMTLAATTKKLGINFYDSEEAKEVAWEEVVGGQSQTSCLKADQVQA